MNSAAFTRFYAVALVICGVVLAHAESLQRAANTTLAMPPSPPQFGFTLANAFPGVNLSQPVCIASPPGETNRLFIVEKTGKIVVITNLASPTRTEFMSLSVLNSGEGGLLGLAFHPGYATNRFFYVFSTRYLATSQGTGRHQRISRFQTSPTNPNQMLSGTELPLISQFDSAANHNGGDLHFGPDGYLYASVGDEGAQYNGNLNSQKITKHFFSAILRIDVDKRPGNLLPNPHPANTTNYFIPADNPYVGVTNFNGQTISPTNIRSEFYAIGFRNPWRMSFDPVTGFLYVGDVGQNIYEEINVVPKGGNCGWAYYEGLHLAASLYSGPGILTNPPPGLNFPIQEYRHTGNPDFRGDSVIGGVVYRGSRISQLYGAYVFGDNGSGNIWMLRHDGSNTVPFQRLTGAAGPTAFGTDPRNGDILVAQIYNNQIGRLDYTTNSTGATLPPTLADTGAFSNLTSLAPNAGVVPYDLNVPFWSDNAIKNRWFSLPDTNQTVTFNADGNWLFPTGTVWIKHFELELTNGVPASRKRLETRLLVKNADGIYGATYRWDSATNATLVAEGGQDEDFAIDDGGGVIRTQTWHYPSRSECLQCHTEQGGFALGFNTAQLNRNFDYGGTATNQLQALSDAGYFGTNLTDVHSLRSLAAATNTSASVQYRARSYLAANCRQCHQNFSQAFWDANITTPTALAGLINGALVNDLGDADNRVIKPGSLANSAVHRRLIVFDAQHMPPLATSVADSQNIALIAAWITNGIASSLALQTPALLLDGASEQATVLANFTSVTNDVTGDPETIYESGNPSVISINASGLLTGRAPSGAAEIIATFGVTSATNLVAICSIPIVTDQPDDTSRLTNHSMTMTVAATGTAPLNYFWFKDAALLGNGGRISGADTASLTISSLTTGDSGEYHCVVSNVCGTDVSASATLTVLDALAIDTQPSGVTNTVGTAFSLGIATSGDSPLSHRWLKDGGNISGATSNVLTLANAQTNDSGNYRVVVTNASGAVTSAVAVVLVTPLPLITTQPAGSTNNFGDTVGLSAAAVSALPVSWQWFKDGAALTNGGNVSGALTTNLILSNVDSNDGGNYFAVAASAVGATTSSVAAVAVADLISPTVAISSPANKAAFTVNNAVLRGSAADNRDIAQVLVSLNGGTFSTAALTNNPSANSVVWGLPLTLAGGTNTVGVKSVDAWGNESSVTNRSFFLSVNSVLTVNLVGSGSVSPNLNGASLLVGKAYSMTASASANNIFTNWSDASGVLTEDAKLRFLMQTNLVLTANFATNRFLTGVAGVYNGLFWDTNSEVSHASAGFIKVTLTVPKSKPPTFSGSLKVNGDTALGFSGAFDTHGDGQSTKPVARKGKGSLTVLLHLPLDGSDRISGSVSNDNIYNGSSVSGDSAWVAALQADRAVFSANTNPATNYLGGYTLAIPGSADASVAPGGDGYGMVKVAANGALTLSGSLGDGNSLGQQTSVSKNGAWPLFVAAYPGKHTYTNFTGAVKLNNEYKGELIGWLNLQPNPSRSVTGSVTWIKTALPAEIFHPGGFTNQEDIIGSKYDAPLSGQRTLDLTNGLVLLSGGNFATVLTNQITLTTSNTFLIATTNYGLKLNKPVNASGLLTGSFQSPGSSNKVTSLRGVVLQDQEALRGFFRDTNQSGAVRLNAN